DVKAAEFPIYPLVVSLGYKVIGRESLPLARSVTLGFFLGAALYLGLAVSRLFGRTVGWVTVAVFMILPLGIPYSRMVHPDFCVLFFANGFFYHAVAFFQSRRIRNYALAGILCTGLFLMKAPYGFYYGFPLGLMVLDWRVGKAVRDLVLLGLIFVVPLALGLWFNDYRIQQEAPHEESLVYPMKWTKESLNVRFFGTLSQRFDPARWDWLLRRGLVLVATPVGAVLAALGFFCAGTGWRDKRRWYLWFLALGMLAYTLLVFPIVTSDHDYYSIPYLVFFSLAAACAMVWLVERTGRLWTYGLLLLFLAAGSGYGLYRGPFLYSVSYFSHDWQRIETGRAIQQVTDPNDVVLSVTLGRSTGWSDPRILWLANRIGWAIEYDRLTPEIVDQYRRAGATVAAVLIAPGYEMEDWGRLFPDREAPHILDLPPRNLEPLGQIAFFRWSPDPAVDESAP
ncbi:MAG: glycosyltransferase family 39 protein, partial [Kiritimatiellae bacterium]|nr:glycosyltransferase family 39 protein [Kiritimatiellia bacterium]